MKVAPYIAPALAVALAFAVATRPVEAATVITQTVALPATVATTVSPGGTSIVSFAQFDPSLGTLLGVSLSFAATSNTTVNIANNSTQTRVWTITPGSTASLSGNGFNLTDTVSGGLNTITLLPRFGPGNPRTASLAFAGSYADADSLTTGFAPYLGLGTVNFTFAALNQWAVAGSGGGFNFNPDSYTGGATLQYNYEQPSGIVPEPATWALLIAGFGMVGVSVRRRRPSGVARLSN
jgi:hypothetical protein